MHTFSSLCINTFHSVEETWIDQGRDGETNIHENGKSLGGLYLVSNAAANDDNDGDGDDSRMSYCKGLC